jgi:hypothetical protein
MLNGWEWVREVWTSTVGRPVARPRLGLAVGLCLSLYRIHLTQPCHHRHDHTSLAVSSTLSLLSISVIWREWAYLVLEQPEYLSCLSASLSHARPGDLEANDKYSVHPVIGALCSEEGSHLVLCIPA